MKRKSSISNPRPPLPLLRASPQRVFHAVQGSEVQSPCSTTQGNNDSSCRKRIKARDLDRDRPFTCKRDASPIPLKERHATYPNNAKTSEFAFFKKFKEDANLRFSSSLQRQKELQSKKFNSSDCFRERASPVKNFCKDFTSHFLVENVTPVNFDSVRSPLGNSSKISEVDVKQADKRLEDTRSKQRNVKNDDIFSLKRQKLRQFIENMSLDGTGESYEKGYGVISKLLSRLIPERNQYRFDDNLEKLQWLPGRCFSRLDYEHHLNNSSSPCCLNKSRGRVFSHSDFSTNSDDNNFHVKYRTKESDCELEGKITWLDVNGSPLTAAVENCKSLISSRFKPRYGLYDQGEPLQLRKQEPEALPLGWDIDNIKDERAFSSQLTEFNTCARQPTSFADDHQPNLHESFGAVGLSSSPFPSSNHRNLYSLPYSSLASYQTHGSSRHNVEKKEDIDAAFNNMHLNFSYIPKCLSQCDNYMDYKGSNDFFRAQSANWLMNNAFDDERQHSSIESLCASGFVFDYGWKYFSGLKEHCQTAYHILEFPLDEMRPTVPVDEECSNGSSDDVLVEGRLPFFIQPESFFQKGKACSVLTDKLSWDAARSEINVRYNWNGLHMAAGSIF